MRSISSASSSAPLLSSFLLATLSACGWIEPQAPDGEVVSPLEAGVDAEAEPDPLEGGPAEPDAGPVKTDAAAPEAGADADAQSPDAGSEPDAETAQDAAPDPDASNDSGSTPAPDAACGDSACEDASAPTCSTDEQCSATDYCSKVTHSCTPRCDAQQACIGPRLAEGNNRVLSDGKHVCYAEARQTPDEFTIWTWDGTATPRALGGGAAARVLLVADGYCYYHASGALQRAPLSGGTAETLQTLASAPRRSWLDATHVWWTHVEGEQLALHRLSRAPGSTLELVHSGPASESWEASNSTHLFRRFAPSYAKCAIAMAPIADPSSVTIIPMSLSKNCTGALSADDSRLVFTQFEPVRHYLFRVDLANPTQENTVSLYSVEPLMYQLRGAFAYGQRVVDGSNVPGVPNTVSYWRAPLAGGDGELLYTPTPGTAAFYVEPYDFQNNVYRTYAILDDLRLIYQHKTEHRLIVRALPAEPASTPTP